MSYTSAKLNPTMQLYHINEQDVCYLDHQNVSTLFGISEIHPSNGQQGGYLIAVD